MYIHILPNGTTGTARSSPPRNSKTQSESKKINGNQHPKAKIRKSLKRFRLNEFDMYLRTEKSAKNAKSEFDRDLTFERRTSARSQTKSAGANLGTAEYRCSRHINRRAQVQAQACGPDRKARAALKYKKLYPSIHRSHFIKVRTAFIVRKSIEVE